MTSAAVFNLLIILTCSACVRCFTLKSYYDGLEATARARSRFTHVNATRPFHGDFFYLIHAAYTPVHGYLSLVICIMGVIANTCNVIVLTRKQMLTPSNIILTGLAITDLLVMVEYIPYSIITYITDFPTDPPAPQKYKALWRAAYVIFHTHYHFVMHSISGWLHVLLAFWRFRIVR